MIINYISKYIERISGVKKKLWIIFKQIQPKFIINLHESKACMGVEENKKTKTKKQSSDDIIKGVRNF